MKKTPLVTFRNIFATIAIKNCLDGNPGKRCRVSVAADDQKEKFMKRNTFKFIQNILIAVVFLLLMDARSFFGLWFHEIAGLVIYAVFILHLILNWTWVKVITKKLFSRINGKLRFNYILDFLLLVGFVCILISGLAIAKMIDFSWLGFKNEHMMIYRSMHTSFSMLVLLIAGVHLGLHWRWVLSRFKRTE